MINEAIKGVVENLLSMEFGQNVKIQSFHPYGSSISTSFRIDTNIGSYFIKTNQKSKFPEMYEAEDRGLKVLKKANCFKVPEVFAVGQSGNNSFILMEFLEEQPRQDKLFENFGRDLANLHKVSWKAYGLAHSNYIGSLRQTNAPRGAWVPFFIEERLQPMLKMAVDAKKLEGSITVRFEKLYKKIEELVPDEPPSLLHGDMWSGNFISLGDQAAIFDPAVYYGNREMDIAMSRLFGGFPEEFYKAYNEEFELKMGWEDRLDLYNLYPILVHVNLFGSDYISRLKYNLARFV
jgi:protein-ribulosamine 3-kinase